MRIVKRNNRQEKRIICHALVAAAITNNGSFMHDIVHKLWSHIDTQLQYTSCKQLYHSRSGSHLIRACNCKFTMLPIILHIAVSQAISSSAFLVYTYVAYSNNNNNNYHNYTYMSIWYQLEMIPYPRIQLLHIDCTNCVIIR